MLQLCVACNGFMLEPRADADSSLLGLRSATRCLIPLPLLWLLRLKAKMVEDGHTQYTLNPTKRSYSALMEIHIVLFLQQFSRLSRVELVSSQCDVGYRSRATDPRHVRNRVRSGLVSHNGLI